MTQDRRRGRRVPPKSHGTRPPVRPSHDRIAAPGGESSGAAGSAANADVGGAADPAAAASASSGSAASTRPTGTRAQNRAAKRATMGVRPKTVRGGRVSGRQSPGANTGVIALVIGAAAVIAAVFLLGNPFGGSPGASSGAAASHGDGTCPTSEPPALQAGDVRTVTMETTKGTITMRVDASVSPIAAGNFVALVACHFYDGTVFHRIMPGFVIQGGDPEGTGAGGPGYTIQDDPGGVPYHRGTVAMARSGSPDSQGSQFFIILSDDANASLQDAPYPYAILGEVTSGMDVVDEIAKGENTGGNEGRALDPVTMTRVSVGPYVAPSASPASSGVPAASNAPSTTPSIVPSTAPSAAPS